MEAKAQLKSIVPQFVVPDVVRTAEFYRDQLGFRILGYFAEPPVYSMVARDNVEIHFGKADDSTVQLNESLRPGQGNDAYIWVTDVLGIFEELSNKDIEILEGPVKRIYESTEVVIRDCDGHQLVFAE